MILSQVFERFVSKSPVSVMVRGLLETILAPQKLDELFENTTETQHTKELLFSTVVEMMNTVACGIRPSIHAAYQSQKEQMNVSVTSVYNKLNGMETNVSAELVRETGASMEAIIRHLKGNLPDLLPGYRIKILDGNALAASEHRLKSLRDCNSAPLPGKSLVVLDPSLMLAIDVFPCEDGHAQERSLLPQVLATVESDDVWIADRNFCTLNFLSGIVKNQAYFIIREHKCLPWHSLEKFRPLGSIKGGNIFEQSIAVSDDGGHLSQIRRIKVVLEEPTRDVDEIRGTYRGMMIAIPDQEWQVFNLMNLMDLTKILQDLATMVNLAVFMSHPRSTKKLKKWVKKTRPTKKPHVSTAKILAQKKLQKQTP
jgi:hypothetical protein